MKQRHTILLTYDRILEVHVDLGLENLRGLYGAGCLNEQFVRWMPERFAMQVDFAPDDEIARGSAISVSIKALYKTIQKSKVTNLKIWLDGEPEDQPAEEENEPVRLH